MNLYTWLLRRLPGPVARIAMALWYTILFLLTLYASWSVPAAEFRYAIY